MFVNKVYQFQSMFTLKDLFYDFVKIKKKGTENKHFNDILTLGTRNSMH